MEGNLRLKNDWGSLIVGSKLTVFALFQFVFEVNFQVQAPGGLIFGGAIKRRVFCVTSLGGLYLEGLIHGRVIFLNFTVNYITQNGLLQSRVRTQCEPCEPCEPCERKIEQNQKSSNTKNNNRKLSVVNECLTPKSA